MTFDFLCKVVATCLLAATLANLVTAGVSAIRGHGQERYANGYTNGIRDGISRAFDGLFDQGVASRE